MPTLLRVDSSARTQGSHSRTLADEVQSKWLAANPGAMIQQRDLAKTPVGPIENETIIGYYTPEEDMTDSLKQFTAESDTLIAELRAADALLISTPMYNFSVPAVLKAWIDQVVRIHKTFGYNENGELQGLVKGKPAYIVTALGAQFSGTPLESMDFLHPYLKTLLGFIGFDEITFFSVESTVTDENQFAIFKQNATDEIERMFVNAMA